MHGKFLEGIEISAGVAARHAADVDASARFPAEALEALKDVRALSALVDGVPFQEVAEACSILGRACSATAMVFAMHQIEVACLVQHGQSWPWGVDYLARLRTEQRLIASVTSEVGTGGDLGRSVAALETAEASSFAFVKDASNISYGENADDFLTTLRRNSHADEGDQIAVLSMREQTVLERTSEWNPLGMRGTCSPSFVIRASVGEGQVLPASFRDIAMETMLPVSHLLWGHLWLGIATEALDRARKAVKKSGSTGLALRGRRLSELHGALVSTRTFLSQALETWTRDAAVPGRPDLRSLSAALYYNSLKTSVSRSVIEICLGCLEIAGMAGYRNDGPVAMGRLLRDALSTSMMVSNDRLHEANSILLMAVKEF